MIMGVNNNQYNNNIMAIIISYNQYYIHKIGGKPLRTQKLTTQIYFCISLLYKIDIAQHNPRFCVIDKSLNCVYSERLRQLTHKRYWKKFTRSGEGLFYNGMLRLKSAFYIFLFPLRNLPQNWTNSSAQHLFDARSEKRHFTTTNASNSNRKQNSWPTSLPINCSDFKLQYHRRNVHQPEKTFHNRLRISTESVIFF